MDLEAQATTEQLNTVVHVIQPEGAEPTDDPEDVHTVIEGVEVLQDMKGATHGCALLLGLIYCLNLEYPSNLTPYIYSGGVDGQKLSRKVQVLNGKLFK